MKGNKLRRVNPRTLAAVLLLLAVLAGCVLLPSWVSRKRDGYLLGRQYRQENDMAVAGYYHETDFAERLALYVSSKDSAYATSQYVEVTDYRVIYSALEELEPELELLREAGLLPERVEPDLSGKSSYLGVITSMDIRDPFRTIAYRELTTSDLNSGMTCFFRQDVESGKIIEFWLSGSGGEPLVELEAVEELALSWAGYLGLQQVSIHDSVCRQTGDYGAAYTALNTEAGDWWVEYNVERFDYGEHHYYGAVALAPGSLEDTAPETISGEAGSGINRSAKSDKG